MAYDNFVPELWAEKIQRENEKMLVLAKLCNRQWEGDLKKKGDTVHILGIGQPAIRDYDGTGIEKPETLADTTIPLTINRAKYFNVVVDDVDRRQSASKDMLSQILSECTEGLSAQEDSDIAVDVYADVKGDQKITLASCTAENARSYLQKAKTKLYKAGVKQGAEIVAVVSPDYLERVEQKIEQMNTDNPKIMENGFMGKTAGISLYLSNNVHTVSGNKEIIYVMTRRAIAHANQINEVKAYSPEELFADAVKGLNVYGSKLVRPKELVAIEVAKYE